MDYDDDRAAKLYADPRNLEPAGPPVRRKSQGQRLTNHVPVRFPATTINQVKDLAESDGVTVSSWIRGVVEREVRVRILTTATEVSTGLVFETLNAPSQITTSAASEEAVSTAS